MKLARLTLPFELPVAGTRDLPTDVAGVAAEGSFRYVLGRSTGHLVFAAAGGKPAFIGQSIEPAAWHFGLWHYDCAEVFLANSATGRYLEVNLAPNAAHWIGVFSAPRWQAEDVSPKDWAVDAHARIEEDGWYATIVLPWDEIVAALGGEPDRGNVTAIFGGYSGPEDPVSRLRSLIPIDVERPDFHVPDRFETIEV